MKILDLISDDSVVKRICLQRRRQFRSLGQEDLREKGLATHSGILT